MTEDLKPRPAPRTKTVFARIIWGFSLLFALVGGLVGTVYFDAATSAPQEASAAALGCFIAIVPYVIARSVEEVTRR